METENTIVSAENQTENATPAGKGEQSEKLFSQDEVNRIVSDRLARDRRERGTQQEDPKEKALNERESRLDCREYLTDKGYPAELLDILDTADAEKFKAAADKLTALYGGNNGKAHFVNPPRFTAPASRGGAPDPFADAFKPKT